MSKSRDFFDFKNGILSAQGVSLESIADQYGTPAYVYSSEGFLKPYHELKNALSGLDVMICFAVKSNSNIAILNLLAQAGAGMDLVSAGELYRAKRAGVRSERIVFSGVGKTPGEMLQALEEDIFSFNVESHAELETLNEVAGEVGKIARVALRFNPDVDAKTHPYISTGLKKNKFGIQKNDVIAIAKNISDYPNVRLDGMSVHIGSQLLSLAPLKDAFTKTRDLIAELDAILADPISFVDLGGGIGITYKNEKTPSIQAYGAMIKSLFGPKGKLKRSLKILVEPGRSISGNAGVLLSSVLYRKTRGSRHFLILDAAMNDLMRPSLYSSFHEILAVSKSKDMGAKVSTDVVGPICESSDCFATGRSLSKNLSTGDLMAILSAGAYGFTMSSQYNSRPRPPEVLIHEGRPHLIRERETFDLLTHGERTL